ncbi:MAG: polyphosphate kinase 1 [Flavobacteriales bacterium]|nr:polyphosphate kinase 1 [Flavobacteriales bacterium]
MEIINRELSWLSFNDRVLQEALDDQVPVVERMRFLGIYSNNMDEFYRVRVANIRRSIALKKQRADGFNGTPAELYQEIREVVIEQQQKFELAYRKILRALVKERIHHTDEKRITLAHKKELSIYFHEQLKHAIFPIILDKKNPFPKLRDYAIYLAVKIVEKKNKTRYALIQIPTDFSRFYQLKKGDDIRIILIDDIIRLYLKEIFSIFEPVEIDAYTFKFTRDAELDLDDDLTLSFIEKIEKSLKQRKKGIPVRFVYDEKMPDDLLNYLLHSLNLKAGINTIPGGRYHNFKDFISFPDFGRPEFVYPKQAPCKVPEFEGEKGIIETILKEDVLLHFPYQRFSYIVDLLREAAIDPKVKDIKINIYRVASKSEIMNALMAAVFNGKQVTVIFELQARFDEENNLYWSERLKEFGAKVIYGFPNLKVHSKLLQIKRIKDNKEQFITYIGTGNFNEKSARIYSDFAYLTSRTEVSNEVRKVFRILENHIEPIAFRKLLVSPFNAKRRLIALIEREIAAAKKGKKAGIKIKLNNLTDQTMINKLYQASQAGVKIDMIIRGICCLIPGKKGLSDNIKVISIVDRYLEHARFLKFENNGKPEYFITSADFMERNLDKRIEVGVLVESANVQKELDLIFNYQWSGSVKARLITADFKNQYRRTDIPTFHAQVELYKYYKSKEGEE